MAIWIIGDTHLSADGSKPMDLFGGNWENHAERLREHWTRLVAPEDTVIVAGDISWGLQLEDAIPDLRFLHELPGRQKVLLRGNHDYWWSTRGKVTKALADHGLDTLRVFQNEALLVEDAIMLGTRGWNLPFDDAFTADDAKVFNREVERLRLSIKDADRLQREAPAPLPRFAVTHFPPVGRDGRRSRIAELLEESGVTRCYYGHVHGTAGRQSFRGTINGITYFNIACDQVDCCPVQITLP